MTRRLAAAIVGVTAGALLLFGLPLALAVTRIYRDDELIRLERLATTATQVVGPDSQRGDPAELPPGGSARLAFYDRAGRRQSGSGPVRADAPVRAGLRGRVGQSTGAGRLVVAVPVARSEQVIGVIRADRSTDIVRSRARNAWLIMATIAAAVLAVASVIAVLLARRITRPVEALTSAVRRLGDGDFTARAPTTSGVAELDEAATALDSTARRLDQLIERERAFSADASHQLRSPLTALRLDLETGNITRALAHADRLQETVATLLAAARDSTRVTQTLDLNALLSELQEQWAGRLAADGRPLRIVVSDALPPALGSAGAVRQILQVLLDNAVVHGAGPVTVTARQTAGTVAVDVHDSGAGISGDLDAIFQRRGTSRHGHGIGLSLARALAVADGGRLVLQRDGPAPTFTLLLAPAPAA